MNTAIIRDVVKARAAEYFKLEESQRDAERIAAAAQALLTEQLQEDAGGATAEGSQGADGETEVHVGPIINRKDEFFRLFSCHSQVTICTTTLYMPL